MTGHNQASCYSVLRTQCLVMDLGHFTVVGKIFIYNVSDYQSILPSIVKCPRSIAKHRIHNHVCTWISICTCAYNLYL